MISSMPAYLQNRCTAPHFAAPDLHVGATHRQVVEPDLGLPAQPLLEQDPEAVRRLALVTGEEPCARQWQRVAARGRHETMPPPQHVPIQAARTSIDRRRAADRDVPTSCCPPERSTSSPPLVRPDPRPERIATWRVDPTWLRRTPADDAATATIREEKQTAWVNPRTPTSTTATGPLKASSSALSSADRGAELAAGVRFSSPAPQPTDVRDRPGQRGGHGLSARSVGVQSVA